MSQLTWEDACARMRNAIIRYEDAKARFDDYTHAWTAPENLRPGETRVAAEMKAAGDPRRIKAAKDAEWFRQEAIMYASAAAALEPTQTGFQAWAGSGTRSSNVPLS